jgi:antitoxin FitA
MAQPSKECTMATLTIRHLDDPIKQLLRERAAASHHSMEEEARQILRNALLPTEPAQDLASRIRARFAGLGDVVLDIPAREAVREPPALDAVASDDGAR